MTSFLLIQSALSERGQFVAVASASSAELRLAALTAYLTSIDVALAEWEDRANPAEVGMSCATELDDGKYLVWQTISTPDWQGRPEDGFHNNDAYRLTWVDVSAFLQKKVIPADTWDEFAEEKEE